MTDSLHLAAGDSLFAVETEQGILLTPHDPEFARAMAAEARISRRYADALDQLGSNDRAR